MSLRRFLFCVMFFSVISSACTIYEGVDVQFLQDRAWEEERRALATYVPIYHENGDLKGAVPSLYADMAFEHQHTDADSLASITDGVIGAWEFGPSGASFERPVFLIVDLTEPANPGTRFDVWSKSENGSWVLHELRPGLLSQALVSKDGTKALVPLSHFSVHALTEVFDNPLDGDEVILPRVINDPVSIVDGVSYFCPTEILKANYGEAYLSGEVAEPKTRVAKASYFKSGEQKKIENYNQRQKIIEDVLWYMFSQHGVHTVVHPNVELKAAFDEARQREDRFLDVLGQADSANFTAEKVSQLMDLKVQEDRTLQKVFRSLRGAYLGRGENYKYTTLLNTRKHSSKFFGFIGDALSTVGGSLSAIDVIINFKQAWDSRRALVNFFLDKTRDYALGTEEIESFELVLAQTQLHQDPAFRAALENVKQKHEEVMQSEKDGLLTAVQRAEANAIFWEEFEWLSAVVFLTDGTRLALQYIVTGAKLTKLIKVTNIIGWALFIYELYDGYKRQTNDQAFLCVAATIYEQIKLSNYDKKQISFGDATYFEYLARKTMYAHGEDYIKQDYYAPVELFEFGARGVKSIVGNGFDYDDLQGAPLLKSHGYAIETLVLAEPKGQIHEAFIEVLKDIHQTALDESSNDEDVCIAQTGHGWYCAQNPMLSFQDDGADARAVKCCFGKIEEIKTCADVCNIARDGSHDACAEDVFVIDCIGDRKAVNTNPENQEQCLANSVYHPIDAAAPNYGFMDPDYPTHQGLDWSVSCGRTIYLPISCRVIYIENDVLGRAGAGCTERRCETGGLDQLGNQLRCQDERGTEWRLGHMIQGTVIDVEVGEVLEAGTAIGEVGNSGTTEGATGCHLHVESRVGGVAYDHEYCLNGAYASTLCDGACTSTCGNGTLDASEVCDGDLFVSSRSCNNDELMSEEHQGKPRYRSGTLSCTDVCDFDVSGCVEPLPPNAPRLLVDGINQTNKSIAVPANQKVQVEAHFGFDPDLPLDQTLLQCSLHNASFPPSSSPDPALYQTQLRSSPSQVAHLEIDVPMNGTATLYCRVFDEYGLPNEGSATSLAMLIEQPSLCVDDDGMCPAGCTEGNDSDCMVATQCSSGPCCDSSTGRYLPPSTACQTIGQRYICPDGTDSGDGVYIEQEERFCSGSSGACDGQTATREDSHQLCSATQACVVGQASCEELCVLDGVCHQACNASNDPDCAVDPCAANPCAACLTCNAGSCVPDQSMDGSMCAANSVCLSGACVAQPNRPSHTIDGCTGTNYDPMCTGSPAPCEGCIMQGGFKAVNDGGCTGETCFNRYQSGGVNGFVTMFARSSLTAYAVWQFPQVLSGNYKITIDIPSTGGFNTPNPAKCPTWNLVTDARFNLKKGTTTERSTIVDFSFDEGLPKLLFEGDLTGVTGITVGNVASQTNCGVFLLDQIRAEPY